MAAIALTGTSTGVSTAVAILRPIRNLDGSTGGTSTTVGAARANRGLTGPTAGSELTGAGGSTARATISVNGVSTAVPDTRSWWPPGYGEDPAFQVRRQVYGPVTGGDYVRGSATPSGLVPTTPGQFQVLTLPHTALRYPTTVAGAAEAVGRAVLHVRPTDHGMMHQAIHDKTGAVVGHREIPVGSVEIKWGWPASIQETWQEMVLVRSAFGRPSTVNDGQAVITGPRSAYTKKNNDGSTFMEDGSDVLLTPPTVIDGDLTKGGGLPTGRWYHYGLFFRVSEVEWIQGMLDSCLLPRDFGHDTHLWNNIPPYYRWTDEQQTVGKGQLQKFLGVFGFELDQAREFIESWQHVYDADWSPIRLLRRLGDNFGYPYEQGIGDIRYRSLFTELGRFYEIRGTKKCLEGVVRRMSKYGCHVTSGANLMILPDDSDFYQSTGNWASCHPLTDGPGTTLTADRVLLNVNPVGSGIVPPVGRGSMAMTTAKADETQKIGLSCGDGFVGPPTALKEIQPLQGGVPVQEGVSYGFSVWLQTDVPPVSVQLSLLWFGEGGLATDLLSTSSGSISSLSTVNWTQFDIGTVYVPPSAAVVYVVPYILFDTRTAGSLPSSSPPINIAGAMLYAIESIGEAVGPPPNQYLTISDPGEPLGGPLTFKGLLSGLDTLMPTVHATYDAYSIQAPVPTATPTYQGVSPARAAAVNDTIYWNGTAWVNVGPIPTTFQPFLLGAPS